MTTDVLAGRVAVVTGASAGIGAATARSLAARGMEVVLGARREAALLALGRELTQAHGVRALAHGLDVTQRDSVQAFRRAAEEFAGAAGIDVLVNNAGLARGVRRLPEATREDEDDWALMIETNVMGLLRTTRAFLAGMLQRGRGHVVNMGSLAAVETYEGGAVYCATKASVRVLSRGLRLELLGSGVRVCCIHPGMVETEFSRVRLGSEEQGAAVYTDMTPLTAEDVAEAVAWVVGLPRHVNIEELQLQPLDQAAAQKIHRRPKQGPA